MAAIQRNAQLGMRQIGQCVRIECVQLRHIDHIVLYFVRQMIGWLPEDFDRLFIDCVHIDIRRFTGYCINAANDTRQMIQRIISACFTWFYVIAEWGIFAATQILGVIDNEKRAKEGKKKTNKHWSNMIAHNHKKWDGKWVVKGGAVCSLKERFIFIFERITYQLPS